MVRCQLELSATGKRPSCWATLTYDAAHLPVTLSKDHLSAFVKRLRFHLGERRFRFFGCGEYGERNGRPHYHIILFGLGQSDEALIRKAWSMGLIQVDRLEPAAIAYVAGYSQKKLGVGRKTWKVQGYFERLDRATGEVSAGTHENVIYQAPFLLMSRRPGIGGDARKHFRSWRKSAIWDGKEVRVPRFLHEAYKANATPDELLKLEAEKDAYLGSLPLDAKLRERAGEIIATKRLNLKQESRTL